MHRGLSVFNNLSVFATRSSWHIDPFLLYLCKSVKSVGQRSCGLWLQGETYYQIRLLGARVSSHLSEDWNRERICNLQVLGGFHTNMSNGKAIGITIE